MYGLTISVEALVFIVIGRSCSEGRGFDPHYRPSSFLDLILGLYTVVFVLRDVTDCILRRVVVCVRLKMVEKGCILSQQAVNDLKL